MRTCLKTSKNKKKNIKMEAKLNVYEISFIYFGTYFILLTFHVVHAKFLLFTRLVDTGFGIKDKQAYVMLRL